MVLIWICTETKGEPVKSQRPDESMNVYNAVHFGIRRYTAATGG